MKNFMNIKEFFRQTELRKKGLISRIDRLSFPHILVIWILIVVSFGLGYHFFADQNSLLYYTTEKAAVKEITDVIYFSFVAATTTGFGDIVPKGLFKLIAVFEVISGLMLLALVTSKLVSIKQDMILSELYELSFNEKINRLRSSLLLFRQNLSRMITRIEDGTIRKREVAEMYMYVSSLEDILNEVIALLGKTGKSNFTKGIDAVNTELIIISILNSFEKLNELIAMMNEKKMEWRREITIELINKTINLDEGIFEKINSSKRLAEKSLTELNVYKKEVISALKKNLSAGAEAVKTENEAKEPEGQNNT